MNILEWITRAACAIAGGALVAVFFAVVIIPIKERAAREGYVLLAEKSAAEAQIARSELLRKSDQIVIESYQVQLKNLRTVAAANNDLHEQEISDYEAKLKAAKRRCDIDADDRDFLLKP